MTCQSRGVIMALERGVLYRRKHSFFFGGGGGGTQHPFTSTVLRPCLWYCFSLLDVFKCHRLRLLVQLLRVLNAVSEQTFGSNEVLGSVAKYIAVYLDLVC